MCILLILHDKHPDYHLIIAANRDEFYRRRSRALSAWHGGSGIVAGQDVEAGGTWMGVTRTGRFAALTNFRDNDRDIYHARRSRGLIVRELLELDTDTRGQMRDYLDQGDDYAGFSVVAGRPGELVYTSNRAPRVRTLKPGCYGLSNGLLDEPWPKVKRGKKRLQDIAGSFGAGSENAMLDALFEMLSDNTIDGQEAPPDDADMKTSLAPIFVNTPEYGTVGSTVLLVSRAGKLTIQERLSRTIATEPLRTSISYQLAPAALTV